MAGPPRPVILPGNLDRAALRPAPARPPPPPVAAAPGAISLAGFESSQRLLAEASRHGFLSKQGAIADKLRDPAYADEIQSLRQALDAASAAVFARQHHRPRLAAHDANNDDAARRLPPPLLSVEAAQDLLSRFASLKRATGVDDENIWTVSLQWPLHVTQAAAVELSRLEDAGKALAALDKLIASAVGVDASALSGEFTAPAEVKPQLAAALDSSLHTVAEKVLFFAADSCSYIDVEPALVTLRARCWLSARQAAILLLVSMRNLGTKLTSGGSKWDVAQRMKSIEERARALISLHARLRNWQARQRDMEAVAHPAEGELAQPAEDGDDARLLSVIQVDYLEALLAELLSKSDAGSSSGSSTATGGVAPLSPAQQQLLASDAVAAVLRECPPKCLMLLQSDSISTDLRASPTAAMSSDLVSQSQTPAVKAATASSAPVPSASDTIALIRSGRHEALTQACAAVVAAGASLDGDAAGSGSSALPPLYFAISSGDVRAVDILISSGACNPCLRVEGTDTPLQRAAAKGGQDGLKAMLTILQAALKRNDGVSSTLLQSYLDHCNSGASAAVHLAARSPVNDGKTAVTALLALTAAGANALLPDAAHDKAGSSSGNALSTLASRFLPTAAAAGAAGASNSAAPLSSSTSSSSGVTATVSGLDLSAYACSPALADVWLEVHCPPSADVDGNSSSDSPVETIPAHALVLVCACDFFNVALGADSSSLRWKEATTRRVPVHGFLPAVVMAALRFIYSGGDVSATGLALHDIGGWLQVTSLASRWLLTPHLLTRLQEQVARGLTTDNAADAFAALSDISGWDAIGFDVGAMIHGHTNSSTDAVQSLLSRLLRTRWEGTPSNAVSPAGSSSSVIKTPSKRAAGHAGAGSSSSSSSASASADQLLQGCAPLPRLHALLASFLLKNFRQIAAHADGGSSNINGGGTPVLGKTPSSSSAAAPSLGPVSRQLLLRLLLSFLE